MAEIIAADGEAKTIRTTNGDFAYDYLVLATGSDYNYFGHEDWRDVAPGLRTLREARLIRQRLLTSFERAELAKSTADKQTCLTLAIVGGGATGVEMAGAVADLGRFMITTDFKNLTPDELRVLLIEAGPRILPEFKQEISDYAVKSLGAIGVQIRTMAPVKNIGQGWLEFSGEIVACGCIVWAAGVKASPAGRWLNIEGDRQDRIRVTKELSVEGHEGIYAIGDIAQMLDEHGRSLPALAQVAKQQGAHLGNALRKKIENGAAMPEFRFQNRGTTAVIGSGAAVFDFGSWILKGRPARFLWAIVHVYLLVGAEKRTLVLLQWIFRSVTGHRGARIIDEDPV